MGSSKRLVALVAVVTLAWGCGASDAELRRAKTSGYSADFAIVYSEALTATRDLYPKLTEDARTGIIRTAWHPIRVSTGNQEDAVAQGAGGPDQTRSALATTTAVRTTYFVRFAIYVVGGRPWRVKVEGEASLWKAGEIPTPLRGADVPPWLAAREDTLRLAIFDRLETYAVPLKFRSSDEVVARPPPPAVDRRFAALPEAAAKVVSAAARAAAARDHAALRPLMADSFQWSFGAEPSADIAIATFQADPEMFAALGQALDAGCGLDPGATPPLVACPAASLGDGYAGYRAGFAQAGDGWKMIYFVAGD